MADAAYYREYRRKNAEKLRAYNRARNQQASRKAQRHAQEAERRKRRRAERPDPIAPLPMLMPQLQTGKAVSFWEDELRLDTAQEAALALIEGRDPRKAVKAYRTRELAWRALIVPLMEDREH